MLLLAIIAWVMLRYSRKLPITQFFAYSSILIAILAVVLAGRGVGALQEAGMIPITLVPGGPRIPLLGISPTAEALGAPRSEEHTSELQSLMRNSYAVLCLKKKKNKITRPMQYTPK